MYKLYLAQWRLLTCGFLWPLTRLNYFMEHSSFCCGHTAVMSRSDSECCTRLRWKYVWSSQCPACLWTSLELVWHIPTLYDLRNWRHR